MADDIQDIFITGLRNAHSIENEALSIMNRQLERIENYPELADRLRRHVTETEGQQRRLEELLDGFDTSHSSFKDTAASLMGSMAALGHAVAGDEILKNSYANFAFENYEIAAYRSLIAMARTGGYDEALPALEANLGEEVAMADWIEKHLPTITEQYLKRELAGLKSDR